MHVRNRGRNRAFTLVEILIVVVILGILAAIVVPQFTNAANDARGGNIVTQMQTLQNQIELFAARNNGAYPDFANQAWSELTNPPAGQPAYLKSSPRNPAWNVADNGGILADTITEVGVGVFGSAASAWVWNTDDFTLYASYYDEANNTVTQNAAD